MLELKFSSSIPLMLEIACRNGSREISVSILYEMSMDSISGKSTREAARMHATLSPIAK